MDQSRGDISIPKTNKPNNLARARDAFETEWSRLEEDNIFLLRYMVATSAAENRNVKYIASSNHRLLFFNKKHANILDGFFFLKAILFTI